MTSHKLGHLKKRAEFLAVSESGLKWVRPTLIVQFLPAHCPPKADLQAHSEAAFEASYGSSPAPHQQNRQMSVLYGLTASRRVGGAVERNRARRRLRAAAEELLLAPETAPGSYVLIARQNVTISASFDTLKSDLATSLRHLARVAAKKSASSS